MMIKALLEVLELPDSPLSKLSQVMNWDITFMPEDIAELKTYVKISNYLIQDMLESLKVHVEDENDSAHFFAIELEDQFKSKFGFPLSKEDGDFQPLLARNLLVSYLPGLSLVLRSRRLKILQRVSKSIFLKYLVSRHQLHLGLTIHLEP